METLKNAVLINFNKKIFEKCLEKSKLRLGEFGACESYFGSHKVRGKRDCEGAARLNTDFGFLKHGGKVLAKIFEDCSKEQFTPVIQGKV